MTAASARSIYIRLLRHVLPHWRTFMIGIVAMAILAATEPAIPAFLERVVRSFETGDLDVVPSIALLLVALFLVRGLAAFVSAVALASVASWLVKDLRSAIFERLMTLPTSEFDEVVSGKLISKVTFDAMQVTEAGTQVVTMLVRDTLTVLGLVIWMIYLDWRLTLIALATAPIVVLVVIHFSHRLRQTSIGLQQTMGDVTHVLQESIDGHRVVRTFGGQEYETRRFSEAINRARRFHVKFTAASAAIAPIAQFITAIALGIILYLAGQRFGEGAITISGFVSFFTAMAMLFSPIKRLTGVNGRLQRGIAAATSVFELVDRPGEVDSGNREIARATGRVAFEGAGFRYPGTDRPALDDITLVIEPGETVALVGPSGSGKTTLASLIPRFYDADEGVIRIDGIDVRELSLRSLRSNIALVSQDIVLFDDTVAANIAYGRLETADRATVERAATAAHALDFIRELPLGMDTRIGERGVRLSGGQRQRIAIARAILKDAPILILDEATSSLDSESERHIQEAVDELRAGRTTIVIAHRLSTIETANRIVVVDEGRVADIGTHAELLERNGLYAGLYRFQFSRNAEPAAVASHR